MGYVTQSTEYGTEQVWEPDGPWYEDQANYRKNYSPTGDKNIQGSFVRPGSPDNSTHPNDFRGVANSKDDGGFEDILKMALPIALSVFGAPYLAAAFGGGALGATAAGAVIGGGSSLITGGDVLKGAVMGGAGGFLGSNFGDAAATGTSADYTAATGDFDPMGQVPNSSGIIGNALGTPQQYALNDTGTMTDAMPDASPTSATAPAADYTTATGNYDPMGQVPEATTNAANATIAGAGAAKSITGNATIDRIINTIGENKGVATLASGALQVAGGVGAALLNSSNVDKQIAANKDLLSQRTDEQIKQEAAKKAAIQGGSYFDANVPFKPAATAPLLRPDGTPVYKNGIINRTIG